MFTFESLLNLFSKKDKKELKNVMRLEVFVDSINSRDKNPMSIVVKKDMVIKELRRKIAKEKSINMDDLVLLINFRFWDDDITISQVVKGMGVVNGGYIVHAVIITDEDDEKIDFDIETFLKEKYSSNAFCEPDFVVTDVSDTIPFVEEMVNVPVVCPYCQISRKRQSIVVLDYCRHEFCKECLMAVVYNSFGKFSKCPEPNCSRTLLDHEYQRILGPEEYVNWENVVERNWPGNDTFIVPKIGWVCECCTFLNKPYQKFCDTCNENRPIEYRIPKHYVPSNEEELIKKQDDEEKKKSEEEMKQQEKDKNLRLEELKSLTRQSVLFTTEVTQCPICLMDYEAEEAIILHSCLHAVCKDCLRNYLLNVEDPQVKCPTENCIGLLEDREISTILSASEYAKYQELSLRMAEAKEKFSFHCKAVNCTAWIINEGNLNSFNCPMCKQNNCIKCETIHDKETCQEYQFRKLSAAQDPSQSKNDLYIQSMIDSGEAMKCPGCRMIVEKNRGCDGVLCRGCGMMICWATKGPRWGPKGKGDRSGGCGCRFLWGRRCHPNCHYCH